MNLNIKRMLLTFFATIGVMFSLQIILFLIGGLFVRGSDALVLLIFFAWPITINPVISIIIIGLFWLGCHYAIKKIYF